ncbi:4-coumarate--CoA ligase, photoactive yellow protein activation family [Pseudidiomarina planktonica]|uniref:4-coumarate--CoA ligase, photoactive yellow protein activation family n=1 Tax=Pseudidiomarina planktonica TaxID=1323738 RepID=A0A1Y6G4G1_9GAMM|nr:AMP-binding protein [Pseudidiomarina planktonica]RUO63262.1 4-coumarate--CoA ligase [Pseudidiomarina planktonica]SMQ80524.1 4-coumarate--CoA ligase, photoactive yellow protein activation family [Pseudidiomarina planktonica]
MSKMTLSAALVLDVIKALVADELKAIRQVGNHQLSPDSWNADTQITPTEQTSTAACDNALQVDSLEWLAMASRVMQFFQLNDSGYEDYLLRYKTLGGWAELVQTARADHSSDITLQTSGSTGSAQAVSHSFDSLSTEAHTFLQHFQLLLGQQPKRIIALTPCHHIYGFIFTVLLPALFPNEKQQVVRGLKAFSTVQGGKLQPGDIVIGVPHIWQQLQRSGVQFPDDVCAVTSTGPCPSEVAAGLKQQGLKHFIEIYGSTETAGIGIRASHTEPFELLPRWNREPDAADKDTLVDVTTNAKVTLGDHLHWLNQRQFLPQGRKDKAVQVAGTNVYPAQIEEHLCQHAEVEQARVRLMTANEGNRLKAFIVPKQQSTGAAGEHDQLLAKLQSWCQTLSAAAQPKHFSFGNQLPVNSMGKAADWPITSNIEEV